MISYDCGAWGIELEKKKKKRKMNTLIYSVLPCLFKHMQTKLFNQDKAVKSCL